MADDHQAPTPDRHPDRRDYPRGGRRDGDEGKPWYLRRRLWLAAASLVFVGWRKAKTLVRRDKTSSSGTNLAA